MLKPVPTQDPSELRPAQSWSRIAARVGFVAAALVLASFWMAARIGADLPETSGGKAPAKQTEFAELPIFFIENGGQIDSQIAYYVQRQGFGAYFGRDGVTYAFTAPSSQPPTDESVLQPVSLTAEPASQEAVAAKRWAVKLKFLGTGAGMSPTGQDRTPTAVSYFRGQPSEWKTGLSTYGSIVYRDLWPGIDLVYGAKGQDLKYEFVVRPGARPEQIKLAYSGATAVEVNGEGQLEVSTPLGGFRDDVPYTYQVMNGERRAVPAAYAMAKGQEYGFWVGDYDRSLPLVIDPVLAYYGYLGGTSTDQSYGIAVDSAGAAYVTGSTGGGFPVSVGPDTSFNGGSDAFVAKVNPAGTGLVYVGYIGGSGGESGADIAVDASGNAYVTGETTSADFPVTPGARQVLFGGGLDGFVTKVNAAGTGLVYSSYIGSTGTDRGSGIEVDGAGSAFVCATFQRGDAFGVDALVWKMSPAGDSVLIGYLIGGTGVDECKDIAVDASGNVYITGTTDSTQTSFPGPLRDGATLSWDLTYGLGPSDAFVAKVNPAGTAVIYAGYIGGSGRDTGHGIAVDSSGNAYVTGTTGSSDPADFGAVTGPDLTYNGGITDGFVGKVNPSGTSLVYLSYVGGPLDDSGEGITADNSGVAYMAGRARGADGNHHALVWLVNPAGTGLIDGYLLGGELFDIAYDIALDVAGNVLVTGTTDSGQGSFAGSDPRVTTDGQTTTFQPAYGGSLDGFVVKIGNASLPLSFTCSPSIGPTTVGAAYTSTCTAAGGTQPYRFFNSTPPAGLTIVQSSATTVLISGTPTEAGAYNYVVEVRDGSITAPPGGQLASVSFSGTISGGPPSPLTFTCSPSSGPTTVGAAYTSTCTAAGGTQPYSFFNSAPPAGLTILQSTATTVTISGAPTEAGAYNFNVEVRDASITAPPGGQRTTVSFSGTISGGPPSPLTLTCSPSTGPTTVGANYTSNCSAAGGTLPYSFSNSTLPAGLTITQASPTTVTIGGAPTMAGAYSFSVEVRDASITAPPGGQRATASFSGTISGGPPSPLTLICSPSTGPTTVGAAYTSTCAAAGGTLPYSFSNTPLPLGLILQSTATTVTISGAPTEAGAYSFSVEVRDASITAPPGGQRATASFAGTLSGGTPSPSFTAQAVVHAASFASGGIAPGEIISIFGERLGPNPGVGGRLDASGAVAKELGGTQVLFDGVPGAMFFAGSNQLNVEASYTIAGKQSVNVVVVRDGVSSPGVSVPVVGAAPGFFTAAGSLIALKGDGSLITADNPARPGDVIVLWATGGGQTNPSGIDGALSTAPFPRPVLPASVTIGGQPAQIAFIGAAPGFAGLLQINVVVGQQTGDALAVQLRIGEAVSQPGMFLVVR